MNHIQDVIIKKHRKFLAKLLFLFLFGLLPVVSYCQFSGWQYRTPITITENSGSALTNYQVLVTLNTQTLISAGKMQNDGDDIRFALRCDGGNSLSYWTESGINTSATKIWVKIPSLPASGTVTVYMFYGNVSAPAQSTLTVFSGPYVSLNTLSSSSSNASGTQNAGWEFIPTEDVLVTEVGKNVINNSQRIVTVFDVATLAVMYQDTAPAGAGWTYGGVNAPFWLLAGGNYIVAEFGNGYYYLAGTAQGGPHLTYVSSRVISNAASSTTFPTNAYPGYHYGFADIKYMIRQHAALEPAVVTGAEQTYAVPVVSVSPNPVCLGSTATISCNSAFTNYNFYLDGSTAQNGAGNNYLNSSMGLGTHTSFAITTGSGCVDTSNTISITVSSQFPVSAGADASICEGGSVQLSAGGGMNYTWNPSAGLSCSNCSNPIASPVVSTTYTLVVSDASGCTGTDEVMVTVNSLPAANAGPDVTICLNGTTQLNAAGGANYSWSTGETTASIIVSPPASTAYTVVVSDVTGCSGTDEVTVTVDSCLTGVYLVNANMNSTISPNPTTGKFQVSSSSARSPSDKFQVEIIEIYNVMGEKIAPSPEGGESNSLPFPKGQIAGGLGWAFDISSQPPGIYFVKLVSEKESVIYKIIKQ